MKSAMCEKNIVPVILSEKLLLPLELKTVGSH
jgi:hypothetical protein